MRQKSGTRKAPAEQVIKNIRRATRKQYSAEKKIRIVLECLRGEESITALCRREGIAESLYYNWSKEFLETARSGLPAIRRVTSARPCSMTSACACCCSSSCTRAARDADGIRRRPRYDQCILCGSIRSAVRHTHFAMVSEETSGNLEYRWTEPDAGIFCRRRHRGPGSGNEGFAPSRKLE